MILRIELASFFVKSTQSGNIEFSGDTIAEALVAFGLDLQEVGFVTENGIICSKESKAKADVTYKVYPTISAG